MSHFFDSLGCSKSFMKAQRLLSLAGLIFLITFCGTLRADIIAIHTSFARGWNNTASTFEVRFGFGAGSNGGFIFDGLTLSVADVGKTFVISQAEDPDYNTVVGFLTNGRSDLISYELSFENFGPIAMGTEASESIFFSPLPAASNGVDFEGFHLDSINLRIDSVTIDSSSFSIQTTILVDPINPVPEPGSSALMMLGAAGIWLRRLATGKSHAKDWC